MPQVFRIFKKIRIFVFVKITKNIMGRCVVILISLIFLFPISSFGDHTDAATSAGNNLKSLYNNYISAKGDLRRKIGRDIIKFFDEQQFDYNNLLQDETLEPSQFDRFITGEVARYFSRHWHHSLCFKVAEDLVNLSEAAEDSTKIMIGYYYMGFAAQRMGKMDEGLKYGLKGYDYSIALNDLKMQSSILNNIGNIYLVNGEDSTAVHYFKKTIDIERKLDRQQNIATRLGNLATAYRKQGKLHEALETVTEGLEIDRKIGKPDKIAVRLHQMAEVLMDLERYDQAMTHEKEALEHFEKEESSYGVAIIINSMGLIEEKRGNEKKAQEHYKHALIHAEKEQNDLLIQRISHRLYHLNRSINPAEALTNYERYITLRDTIFNAENQKQLNDFRIQYETREKESQIALQQAEITQTKLHRTLLTLVVFFALFFVSVLYYLNRHQQNQNRKLSELNATKDKLFSIISHDLKSPAIAQKMAVDNMIDELEQQGESKSLTNRLKTFRDATEAQLSLLLNLLNWANLQTGRMKYTPIAFNLSEMISKAIDLHHISAQNNNLNLIADTPDKCIVIADKQMINTVIRNLLSNAIKFSMPDNDIRISVTCNNKSVRVAVTDSGIGMPQQQINDFLIYDKNISREGTRGEKGSGLGLIICRELLEKNNSRLNIRSEKESGTEVWFELSKG